MKNYLFVLPMLVGSLAACGDDVAAGVADASVDMFTNSDTGVSTDAGPYDAGADEDGGIRPEDMVAFREGGDNASRVTQVFLLADSLFEFDPTLNVSETAAMNASAIEERTNTTSAACATVMRTDAMLSIDFGSTPGCTLTNGAVVTGLVTLQVLAGDATVSVLLALDAVTVNDTQLSGSLDFSTTNATSFTVSGTLETSANGSEPRTIEFNELVVSGSPGSMSIDGDVDVSGGGSDVSLNFMDVVYAPGSCYPSAGTLVISRGIVTQTITFTASTPTTGVVTLMQGPRTTMPTLPAYGTCPHA